MMMNANVLQFGESPDGFLKQNKKIGKKGKKNAETRIRVTNVNDTFCVHTSFVELIDFVKLNSVYSVEASHRSIFTHRTQLAYSSRIKSHMVRIVKQPKKKSGEKRERERRRGKTETA